MNECEDCDRLDCRERGCIAPVNKGIWQSIETAPTDGTAILLWPYSHSNIWEGKANAEVVLGYFSDRTLEWYNPESQDYFEPTHWMPLPNPPE